MTFFKRKACSKTSAKGDQWPMGNVFGSVLPLKDSSKVCKKNDNFEVKENKNNR